MGVGDADEWGGTQLGGAVVGLQEHNQGHVVSVQEGVTRAEKLKGIGGEERETGGLKANGTTVWFPSCPPLKLTLITYTGTKNANVCTSALH